MYHKGNLEDVASGITRWWKASHSRIGKYPNPPRMHLLESVRFEGDEWNVTYTSVCGYEFTFKRVWLDRPKCVKRAPLITDQCKLCKKTTKEPSSGTKQ